MQGIEFETDKAIEGNRIQETPAQKTPTMTRWLMLIGITDASMANYILIGIAGIGIGLTIFIYANALTNSVTDLNAETRAILIMQTNR